MCVVRRTLCVVRMETLQMNPTTDTQNTANAVSAGHRQTLPDALAIGERVRRATLAATALHLIEVRRDATRTHGQDNDARIAGANEAAA